MYNVIIIGGMAAGCKAAARLNRLSSNYQITIIEKSSYISFSSCGLPLFAAGELNDLSDLNKTPYGILRDEFFFRDVKGIRILLNTEVKKIDTVRNVVQCNYKEEEFELSYHFLILATGTESIEPNFPYTLSPLISSFYSPASIKYFRQAVQKGEIEKVAIIGCDFSSCEIVEAFSSIWGIETILIEKEHSLLASYLDPEISSFVESCIKSDKIRLLLSTSVDKIEINEKELPVIFLGNGEKIVSDYVFYCLGVKPNTNLACKSNIRTGNQGGILVDEQMRTNIHNIWAAGGCVEIRDLVTGKPDYLSPGSLSNIMGRVAADSIAGENSTFKGSVGSYCLTLFNNNICSAGLTEKRAKELCFKTSSVIGFIPDRAEYDPEGKTILGKLVYEKPGFRLLGLQLIGEGEVTRYIDTFSILLSQKRTVHDLFSLQYGCNPVHSPSISPLSYLGFMATNQEIGGVKNINPILASSFNGLFVDVRELPEIESLPFSGKSIHMKLSELRERLKDFDLDYPIIFFCQKGPRGYEAAGTLVNYGYKNVSYLGGGNLLYSNISKSCYAKNLSAKG